MKSKKDYFRTPKPIIAGLGALSLAGLPLAESLNPHRDDYDLVHSETRGYEEQVSVTSSISASGTNSTATINVWNHLQSLYVIYSKK